MGEHDKHHGGLSGLIYAICLPAVEETARSMGYAICLHGSLVRDFDMVAVPWSDEVEPPEKLVESIAALAEFWNPLNIHGPEKKPHGRLAWSIALGGDRLRFDLSVIPAPAEGEQNDGD